MATRPDEQAVSMATHGPFSPNMYDMRPALANDSFSISSLHSGLDLGNALHGKTIILAEKWWDLPRSRQVLKKFESCLPGAMQIWQFTNVTALKAAKESLSMVILYP